MKLGYCNEIELDTLNTTTSMINLIITFFEALSHIFTENYQDHLWNYRIRFFFPRACFDF